MPESSLPKPGGGRLAKYAANKVAEKAAAVRNEIRDELPVKPGGGRLAKYAADRVAEEAAAARVEIVTTAAHRAQMAGLRALNVALAAATPILRQKLSKFLLRASADGRAVAQIYPKPLDKKELKEKRKLKEKMDAAKAAIAKAEEDAEGTVSGFAPDLARALEDFCDINIHVTQTAWTDCWMLGKA